MRVMHVAAAVAGTLSLLWRVDTCTHSAQDAAGSFWAWRPREDGVPSTGRVPRWSSDYGCGWGVCALSRANEEGTGASSHLALASMELLEEATTHLAVTRSL
jgi:hypothetical protein